VAAGTAAPLAPASPIATEDAGASPGFAALRDSVLDGLLADDPATARDLGLHEYDGKVAPVSKEALAARIERLERAALDLDAVDARGLSDDDALDRAELASWVASQLFWLVDVDAPRRSPQSYETLFAVSTYVDRDYAPLEERARRLTAHEEAALEQVRYVRGNLLLPLSKPVAEVAARNFAGYATYLRGDVAKILGRAGDDAQRARFARANLALAREAEALGKWLAVEAPRGDQSHVLGPRRYAQLLRVQEGLSVPIAELERRNEEDLAANRKAYEALAPTVRPKPVVEAALFETARTMMAQARTFVQEHAIATLPSGEAVVVRETPPYERWNAASIEMSGPFEAARSAFYQLTLPDRSWPEAERQAYLGSMGDLLGTTIHEVFPGHFVQGRWAEGAPTRVQKAFWSYSFVEGWAHYAEQMMIDEGFGGHDPADRLAMLRGALLRNCRFAASLAIHVHGASVAEAERRFTSDCHQDAATAHEQAARGTFDPGYFAYTLGKLQIIALREEVRRKLGDRFSLGRFHDALLSHGSPPIALVHDRVMRELGAE